MYKKFGLILSICSQDFEYKRILTSIKGSYSVAILQEQRSGSNGNTKFGLNLLFFLKILSKNQILTSIKGRNSLANLGKTMIYNTNIDLVNYYVYTKFGLNRFIRFQDIEQKQSDVN